ncbi:unnamed protein product [Brassica napus]|uniref:(rape) hypothetical protein n=1 Tax=Brassica napus TaxID=3708 RepID=A0A816T818_BRANA|nr:unnamed protein product [Brassica napus]
MDNDLPADVVGEVKGIRTIFNKETQSIQRITVTIMIEKYEKSLALIVSRTNRSANDPIEPPVSAGYNGEEDLTVEEGCSTKNTRTDEVLTPGLIVTLNCLPRFDTKLNNSDINGLPQSLDLSLLQV